MYADVYFGMIPSVDDRKAYMVFGAATDAAGSIRSDVSAVTETRCQKRTRMYAFGNATTQMPRIFQKD